MFLPKHRAGLREQVRAHTLPLTERSATANLMSSRSTQQGARSILSAAATLFANDGFDAVSVAQIAKRAGVSKANVFHHYESKEALFLAVMHQASTEHAAWAEALLAESGSCAERLRRLVAFEMETMFAHVQRTRLCLREAADQGAGIGRKLAQQVFQRNFTPVVALFRQGQSRGEFRKDFDPAVAAITFRGALSQFFQFGSLLRQFDEAAHLNLPAGFASKVCDLLLDGVVARRNLRARQPVSRLG